MSGNLTIVELQIKLIWLIYIIQLVIVVGTGNAVYQAGNRKVNEMNNLKSRLLVAFTLISTLAAPMASAIVLSGGLARVDYSGNITSYVDNTGAGTYGGITNFNGSYLIDNNSTDQASSNTDIGIYNVTSPSYAGFQSGAYNFGSAASKMFILNDYSAFGTTIDAYLARNVYKNTSTNEILVWGVLLMDFSATAFNSDSWIAEPVLSSFTKARFFLRSFNLTTYALNYSLKGNVTYLKDPACGAGTCNNAGNLNLVKVPEPSILLLFLFGLITLGVYSKSSKN